MLRQMEQECLMNQEILKQTSPEESLVEEEPSNKVVGKK